MNHLEQIARELKTTTKNMELLQAMDETSQRKLLEHIQHAHKTNEKHIYKSMEQALEHFPRMLRGPVKRIFGL
ncbi:MAG: hypothetical protein MI867_11115 [Pseudomonadales bacterium]|nr:hypothetical protein [Pseudomonadales bacterium]